MRWRNIFGAMLAFVSGYILWRAADFVHRLRRQPRAADIQAPVVVPANTAREARAAAVAAADLRRGLEARLLPDGRSKTVLSAGARNFREPWARDFGFAVYGLLALGEVAAVREGLEVFFHFQRPSGQFPVKAYSNHVLERYLFALFGREQPVYNPLRPKYRTAHQTLALDGNALLVNAALYYARRRDEEAFIKKWWPALRRAMAWLAEHEDTADGLVVQGPFADWADSIARQGKILYTNVLYWKAATEMAWAADHRGTRDEARHFSSLAGRLKQKINDHFWNETAGFFISSHRFRTLSSDGNLLAAAWGLASAEQTERLLDNMDALHMADPVPTQVVSAPYPSRFIALENRLAGIPAYHTHAAWLWLGAWHVVALQRSGRRDQAAKLYHLMAEVILRDGVVHEVYGRDGQFLKTRWYTSEAPLTWNAAMFVYAGHMLDSASG